PRSARAPLDASAADQRSEQGSVLVRDGATGAPVAGAEVFCNDGWQNFTDRSQARRLHLMQIPSRPSPEQVAQSLWTRLVTRADGTATIPSTTSETATLWARRGERISEFAFSSSRGHTELHLLARRAFEVRVVDEQGAPLAGVPVALCQSQLLCSVPVCSQATDREGRTRLTCYRLRTPDSELELEVSLDFPLAEPVRRSVDPEPWPARPITLVCPPVGALELTVSGAAAESAILSSMAKDHDIPVRMAALLHEERARFWPVGLGLDLRVGAALRW